MSDRLKVSHRKSRLLEVLPGIFQLRLPLAFGLGHSNAYVLRDGDAWLLYDCGYSSSDCQAIWHELLQDELRGGIARIVVSHHHPDHMGNARWLEQATQAEIYMADAEKHCAEVYHQSDIGGQFHAFLEKHGMDRASAQQVVEQYVQSQLTSPLPEKILPIKAGDIFAAGPYRFQAYILGGHSDAQVILFDAETGAALVSDHLLQFITPNIALWPYGDRKPLTSYFKSLEVLKGLNIQTVLPGHHKVYRTADRRIEQLKVHHRDLLEKIENSLMGKLSAFDLAARVFGTTIFRETRFVLHKMLAQQEILSHLQYLASTGQVLKHEEDRVYWQIAPLP